MRWTAWPYHPLPEWQTPSSETEMPKIVSHRYFTTANEKRLAGKINASVFLLHRYALNPQQVRTLDWLSFFLYKLSADSCKHVSFPRDPTNIRHYSSPLINSQSSPSLPWLESQGLGSPKRKRRRWRSMTGHLPLLVFVWKQDDGPDSFVHYILLTPAFPCICHPGLFLYYLTIRLFPFFKRHNNSSADNGDEIDWWEK